ncbi:hypothetical protein ABMA28_004180 [Loxostege sticticalis]|uniref:Uncharacterized protein n=1 Tax=Loxostege sticticalis TaxID=481309 RepID=A0ABD0SUI2_LOXSC
MIVGTFRSPDRPLDQDELMFRRRALRDAVICIGWLKLTSVICYVLLYVLVHMCSSDDRISVALQIMLLVMIPAQIINGLILFYGALEEKTLALDVGLWLCLIIAAYNTVVGVVGCAYFVRKGQYTMHFLLAIVFACQTCSLITSICHDILIVYAYKEILQSTQGINFASCKAANV